MKYLALVAACLLTVALGAPLAGPAVADDGADPVRVTFPAIDDINPEHTPYVLQVQDPEPDRGDLVVRWGLQQEMALPHNGSVTVPIAAADADAEDNVVLQAFRCPAGATGDACTAVGAPHGVQVETRIGVWLENDRPLGRSSAVPIDGYGLDLAAGDVIDLDWVLAAARGGEQITSGSAGYVIGDPLPRLAIPADTAATSGVLTVHVVTDSARWGRLEGTASETYRIDVDGPSLPVAVLGDVVFPAKDGYLDAIDLRFSSAPYDLDDLTIDLVDRSGHVVQLHHGFESKGTTIRFNGTVKHEPLPAGRYTIRVTGTDAAGNATVRDTAIRIDLRRRVEKVYRATISAARTVADTFVGACSHLGAAAGRGWKGSLGLYSTAPCAKKNGSVVLTVHGAQVPAPVGGYPKNVEVSLYGGAARGSDRAYVVHGWLGTDNEFLGRRQLDGRLGTHATSGADPADVVREIDGRYWVYWQLGLSEGSRYDVRSFTVRMPYYALVPPASRTASDAKTIAEPSGAPGPGYTLPKTDAAELPAAYSPAM